MLPSLASFGSLLQICWLECPKTSHHPTATMLIPEMEVEVATRNFDRKNGTTQATAECHVLQGKHSGAHKATFSSAEFRSADAAKVFSASCFYSFIASAQHCQMTVTKFILVFLSPLKLPRRTCVTNL